MASFKEQSKIYNRRDFLNTAALVAGAAVLPARSIFQQEGFPESERLGRIAVGMVDIKSRPDYDAPTIGTYYEDAVVPWYQEVIGPMPYRNNQRWVETDQGFIWSPNVQPVKNLPNSPVAEIPDGMEGFWVEVTLPYTNAIIEQSYSTWWNLQTIKNLPPRFYFSQIEWVDQIKEGSDGKLWYRINERYGSEGDLLWAPAEAFRPISEGEISPISPDIEDKQIVVDVTDSHQHLSCFENGREVHYCRISSGQFPNVTPQSAYDSDGYHIWRKLMSLQMAGGSNKAGWMIPGIGYVALFLGSGIAIHSTFWHNNFGEPSSHGCVNASPDDAKWIYRWTTPEAPFPAGDITVSGTVGTPVKVIEY